MTLEIGTNQLVSIPTESIKKHGKVVFSPSDLPARYFKNIYGERYILQHKGSFMTLSGDETDWGKELVINAVPINYQLSSHEIPLVVKAYKELVSEKPLSQKFKGMNLSVSCDGVTELKNQEGIRVCPVCFRKETSIGFHIHHVIPACCGGADGYWNVANICKICHSAIHLEEDDNEDFKGAAIWGFQKYIHGALIYKHEISKRFKGDPERVEDGMPTTMKTIRAGVSKEDYNLLDSHAHYSGLIDYQVALLCLEGNKLAKESFHKSQEWQTGLSNDVEKAKLLLKCGYVFPYEYAVGETLFDVFPPSPTPSKRIKKKSVSV